MTELECDIIIVGAGPAGATMAIMLAGSGLQVVLVDKDRFPREKICGDALSGKVVSILKRMPGDIYRDFQVNIPKTPSYGTRFISPGMHILDLPFPESAAGEAPGYICPRKAFDEFLVKKAGQFSNVRVIGGEKVTGVIRSPGHVTAVTDNTRITGRLIAGADGVNSVVRRFAELPDPPSNHLCTGVRAYFEGVEALHKDNFIELVFSRELLPYYFWIFPEVDGRCNAGLAVLRSDISKKKVNAGALFEWHLRNHPAIAPRFANARMTGPPGAYSLPLGIRPGTLSGDRFLLLGDAASLVDPFTGEGIGNAMASGEVAARVARKCFGTGDLTPGALYEYDKQLKRRIGKELRTSTAIKRLARSPWLFDLVTIKPVFYCLASLRIVRVPR